jgi:O-antigen ligase
MRKNKPAPDLSQKEAAGVVFRAVLGLAVVVALVLPATLRNHDVEISALEFTQAQLTLQESATEHRRDTFEAHRLAYEAKPTSVAAFIGSAKAHVAK